MSDIILNHIDERRLAILLNGRSRNQRHPPQCVHQQPRVDELVREERIVFVVEEGSPFYRPGRRVDLIVEGQQNACGNPGLGRPVEGIDGELGLPAQAVLDLAQAVFRYSEDHGDGLQLRDDCECCASCRLDHVARVDQPQARPGR